LFEQPEPLSVARHGDLRLRRVDDFRFAAGESRVPLVAGEVVEAAKHFPIVFPVGDEARPVAVLGLEAGANRFVDGSGQWTAGYLPAHIRRYPFILGRGGGDTDGQVIMLDPRAPQLDQEDGEPLFADTTDGERADLGEAARAAVDFLRRFQREADEVPARFEPLVETGVLVERGLDIKRGGEVVRRIGGIRVVYRERLVALDDATLAAWARDGLLEIVHAHLQSLDNLRRLA